MIRTRITKALVLSLAFVISIASWGGTAVAGDITAVEAIVPVDAGEKTTEVLPENPSAVGNAQQAEGATGITIVPVEQAPAEQSPTEPSSEAPGQDAIMPISPIFLVEYLDYLGNLYYAEEMRYGAKLEEPVETPLLEGHTFGYWYDESEEAQEEATGTPIPYEFPGIITGPLRLRAFFIADVPVSYRQVVYHDPSGNYAAVADGAYAKGDVVALRSAPSLGWIRPGYSFLWWTLDPYGTQPAMYLTMGSSNIHVYAQWASVLQTFQVSISHMTESGRVVSAPSILYAAANTAVSYAAVSKTAYKPSHAVITYSGYENKAAASGALTMPAANVSIVIYYTPVPVAAATATPVIVTPATATPATATPATATPTTATPPAADKKTPVEAPSTIDVATQEPTELYANTGMAYYTVMEEDAPLAGVLGSTAGKCFE